MKRTIALALVLLFLFGCASPATRDLALSANVPSTLYPTIQKCVDNTTVCNVTGNFSEVVRLNKSNVTLTAIGAVKLNGAILIYGDNNTVQGFTITDKQSKAGIRIYGDNNTVENNEIYDTLEDGIWFWGTDNIIRGNYMHDLFDDRNYPTVDNHVDCMMSWDWSGDWTPATNTLIENNICDHTRAQGSNQSIIITGTKTTNTTFRGNRFIMHDAGYSPLALYGGTGYTIENNYLCNTTGKGSQAVWIEGGKNIVLKNNTWAGYSALNNGIATIEGNIKSATPCNVFGNPTPTQSPTPPASPTPKPVIILVNQTPIQCPCDIHIP